MQKVIQNLTLIATVIALLYLTGCSTVKEKPSVYKEPPTKKELSKEEQKKLSLKPFKEVLTLRETGKNDPETLSKIEQLYFQIQTSYPESPLAEESYLHLAKLYLRDYKPPRPEKAEKMYLLHKKLYPDSSLSKRIKDFIVRYYHAAGMWNRLLDFLEPDILEFIKTGKIKEVEYLYMYAEAKYHLSDIVEAVKGYEWVIKLAPETNLARRARAKLEKMKAEGKLRP